MSRKILSLTLSISLLFQYSGFAQSINLADYLSQGHNPVALDRFRPLALRYFSYEPSMDNFKILLDKGDQKDLTDTKIKDEADRLLTYFKIGLSLPNEKFWVNLRPDAADQIIDPELEKTDLGKVLLEADLQLKKDTSSLTSPQSKEGKVYWEKLYKKAGELFGTENITIPTITRPWIVPGEIIVRESKESAYIYKAVLKVMLEEDYLADQKTAPQKNLKTEGYNFSDPRLKELNKYSTELIKEIILPELTKRINSSKDYASLRQVFFSLILARWFKDAFGSSGRISAPENSYVKLINSQDLTNLTSKESWSKTAYFNEYNKSFAQGEYNLSEKIYTPTGQSIRRYTSGGGNLTFGINAQEVSIFKTVGSPAVKKDMFQITEEGDQKVGSPLEKYRDNLKNILSEWRDKGGLVLEYEYDGINDILNNPNAKPYLLFLILNYLKDGFDYIFSESAKMNEIYDLQEEKNSFSAKERIEQAEQTLREIFDRNKAMLGEQYAQKIEISLGAEEVEVIFGAATDLRQTLNNMYVEMPADRVILNLVINDLKKIIYDKKTEKISGSPLVEDKELAEGLSGKLNKDGTDGGNLFNLIEDAFEGQGSELGRAGERVVKFKTDIDIAGNICKTLEVSRFQKSIKGSGVKYRTIEFFSDKFPNEYVLQIQVYNDGRIEALSRGTISDDQRLIITAVTRKIFKAEYQIILEELFKKTGLNYELVKLIIKNRQGIKGLLPLKGPNDTKGYVDFDQTSIKIGERSLSAVSVMESPENAVSINVYDNRNMEFVFGILNSISSAGEISTIPLGGLTDILPAMENANEIQIGVVDMILGALKQEHTYDYSIFRGKLLNALNATKSSSAVELKYKTDEFKNLLSVVLYVMREINLETSGNPMDKDLDLLNFKNTPNARGEIQAILEKMDSVLYLNGIRENVSAALAVMLSYKDAGRIDKEIEELKKLYASLNANILADRFYSAGLTKSKLEGITAKGIKSIEKENKGHGLPGPYYVSRYHLLGPITVEGAEYYIKVSLDEERTDNKSGRIPHRIMELVPQDEPDTLEPLIRLRVFDYGIAAEIRYAGHKEPKNKDSNEPAWKEAKRKTFSGLFNANPQEIDRLQKVLVDEVERVFAEAFTVEQKMMLLPYEQELFRLGIMGKRLFGGNWKGREDITDEAGARKKAGEFKKKFEMLSPEIKDKVQVVIFPEAKWVKAVAEVFKDSNISVGVQSLFFNPEGDLQQQIDEAVKMGATYANVGHSMHRLKGEGLTDAQANKIMKAILKDKRLIPWYVIEESGKRNSGQEIEEGVEIGLKDIPAEVISCFPITLEPTMLISTQDGSGKVNSSFKVSGEDAYVRVRATRKVIDRYFGKVNVNVGYGASVKSSNSREIFAQENVKNALVGGASLEADAFFNLVVNAMKGVDSFASSAVVTGPVGGIDLTQMNMLIQPQGGFASSSLDFSLPALNKAEIEAFDLDKELELIQRMASSGIDPIDERLKKYLAVCFARGRTGKEIDELKLCLEDVFTAQQLDARQTPDGYKEVIVIADTRRYVVKESRLAAGKSNVINLN